MATLSQKLDLYAAAEPAEIADVVGYKVIWNKKPTLQIMGTLAMSGKEPVNR